MLLDISKEYIKYISYDTIGLMANVTIYIYQKYRSS